MRLARLLYASRMAKGVNPSGLIHILEASKRNNEKLKVTGVLCYAPAGFLQVLEGPSESVNELYRRIVQDPRNESPTLLSYTEIAKRNFPDWSMAYIRSDEVDMPIVVKYTGKKEFNPFSLSPSKAQAFLMDIAAQRRHFLLDQEKKVRGNSSSASTS